MGLPIEGDQAHQVDPRRPGSHAIDRDPRNTSLKRDLIHVEAEIDGLAAGLAAARDFAKSDPDNSLYDVVSAELYEKAGRSEEAAGLLEKAVAARPSDTDLRWRSPASTNGRARRRRRRQS